MKRGYLLAFMLTGRVSRVRESTNQTTGEKSAYVEIEDWALQQEVACTLEQARGLTAGATVQVPVTVRASAFNGQARLTVRATDAFKVAQQASR